MVAVNQDRGKAMSDSGLESNMSRFSPFKAMLNKAIVKNTLRSVGTALSYGPSHIYDPVDR